MTIGHVGQTLDRAVGDATETLTRRLTRRDVVRRAVLGGATGIAFFSIGQRSAFAAGCQCGPTSRCSGCPSDGCPSGYSLCKKPSSGNCTNNQGYNCIYPSGYWIACSGLGFCGNGYETCYDCIGPSGCAGWCTCLSSCYCCECCTPEQVRAEALRFQESLPN